jgi:hypothetical protein
VQDAHARITVDGLQNRAARVLFPAAARDRQWNLSSDQLTGAGDASAT